MRIEKFPKSAIGRVWLHNNRTEGDGVTHANEDIDPMRTHLNYCFVKTPPKGVKQKMKDYYHQDRENLVAFCELRLTLPQDVKPRDEKRFFETAYEFFCEDWGKENVLNAVVHKDETTPHMHLDFLPVMSIEREKLSDEMKRRIDNYEAENHVSVKGRICAKDSVNRPYLQKLHIRMLERMTKVLGYPCEILNGATDSGNRTVQQLKNESMERELAKKQSQLQNISKRTNYLMEQIQKSGFDTNYFSYAEVFRKLSGLMKENMELKMLLNENSISIPRELVELAKDNVSRFDREHFMITDSISEGSVRVIETYRKKPRIMPEWKFIQSDPELEWAINRNPQEIFLYNGYLIFPTDSIYDTVANLIWLKEHESEYEQISFPQISNDHELNLAEHVLRACSFSTEYRLFMEKQGHEPEKNRQME